MARHFALAYRSAYSGATRRPCQSSRGHASLFRTVPSANTLVRWVNENAFASIVQARPCPTFGRPVHHRGSPHRLRPGTSPHALRIPPRDGHPALRRTASGGSRSALACVRLSPSCPFRLLHTFLLLRPARHYPRVRIWRSSSERQRDFNPPEQRAAQRTLRAVPPLNSASGTLALVVSSTCGFSVCIGVSGSTFRIIASDRLRPPQCRMPLRSVNRLRRSLSRVNYTPAVLTSSCQSPDPVLPGPFPPVLTTMAFDHSRRRWFGTCSCKPVPRGLPSSFKQLHTLGPPRPFALVAHCNPRRRRRPRRSARGSPARPARPGYGGRSRPPDRAGGA